MADYLIMGQQAFKDGMTEDQIKHQHPQFRAAYRAARKTFEAINAPISSLRPEKVLRPDPDYVWQLQWSDLTSITGRKPWNKLDSIPELKVLAHAVRKTVWNNREKLNGFGDAVQMVKTLWEGLLQQGYDQGVLDESDLLSYGYTPKVNQVK